MKYVTCNECRWVHAALPREEVEAEVNRFNTYFDNLDSVTQEDFYGGRRPTIDRYLTCFKCGNDYHNFREAADSDCQQGNTLQAIMDKD